jgi:hypothetical protein
MAKAKPKTKKPNRSAKIREALTTTPEKPAAEIAKDLKVTPALVYNVKANMAKKKAKGKRGRKSKAHAKAAAPHGVHAALDSAFEFITKVGGLLHAEQLIAKLKSIKEKL